MSLSAEKPRLINLTNIKNGRLIGTHYTRGKKGYNPLNHQGQQRPEDQEEVHVPHYSLGVRAKIARERANYQESVKNSRVSELDQVRYLLKMLKFKYSEKVTKI